MRITAIEIENFKGIADRVRVELKPITLLFGANSAGKSTILHALLYLRDVLERRNLDAITTPVSGAALDLGGFRRFVHGQDLTRPICIRVDMEVMGDELPPMASLSPFNPEFSRESGEANERFIGVQSLILQSIRSAYVEIEVRWDPESRTPFAYAYRVGLNNEQICTLRKEDIRDSHFEVDIRPFHPVLLRQFSKSELEKGPDYISQYVGFAPINETAMESDFYEIYKNNEQLIGSISQLIDIRNILFGLTTNWMDTKDPIPRFKFLKNLQLRPAIWTDLDCWNEMEEEDKRSQIANSWAWDVTAFCARLIFGPGKLVHDWLHDLRYIGPLRARPPREGTPSVELDDWAEGLAAWKRLEETQFKFKEVSDWLSHKDRLNSGYELTRKRLVELNADDLDTLIAGRPTKTQLRALLRNASERTQINLLETRSGLELAPSEVGVGLSQVLPVVVAALDSPNGLVSIEQPELHIHPAMQVALGDLFIEGALKRGTQFLIETHSEHLILRLMRRIRENHISPEAVSVMFVMPKAQGIKFKELHIDEDGDFIDDWPGGFFEESFHEKFAGR